MASEETGYGKPEDKQLKNEFATRRVWESIASLKTVGIIDEDRDKKVILDRRTYGDRRSTYPVDEPDINGDVQGDHFRESTERHCGKSAPKSDPLYRGGDERRPRCRGKSRSPA